MIRYNGYLEIDHARGVIYFHQTQDENKQPTLLRICRLPHIPLDIEHIDVSLHNKCNVAIFPQNKETKTKETKE
jgi:hypothetical protein